MKDNFSSQAELYARFRPSYPKELFSFLAGKTTFLHRAWDCGTGNGQVAVELAKSFEEVVATDSSENQIRNAVRKRNIEYRVEPAERCSSPDRSFDLITAGQALHWFDLPKFYNEARRTLKPRGLLAVFGYTRCHVDDVIDGILNKLYFDILETFWDQERIYVEERYRSLSFPFEEIETPEFIAAYDWRLDQMLGYLETWSAVQHYINHCHQSPLDEITPALRQCWEEDETKRVTFPVFARVGAISE